MKKTILLAAISCLVFLSLCAAPALAAGVLTPAADVNGVLLSEAASAIPEELGAQRQTFLFTLGEQGQAEVPLRASLGNIIISLDSNSDQLLSLIPEVKGGGVYLTDRKDYEGRRLVAWYAKQPDGYYATGLEVVDEDTTSEELAKILTGILETVRDDPERHENSKIALAANAVGGEEVLAAAESTILSAAAAPYWRDIATCYPPDTGSGWWNAYPYGKIGRGLDVDELWSDGSDTLDYWRGHCLDQVVPGIYAFGNDWRSLQYRIKSNASYSYIDILEAAPPSTNQSLTFTFGSPGSFAVGQTVYDMSIEKLCDFYGSPNYFYWKYNFDFGAAIAQQPYDDFSYWWRQTHTQNYAFDCVTYNSYKVVDPGTWGNDTMDILGGGWGAHVNKPGY